MIRSQVPAALIFVLALFAIPAAFAADGLYRLKEIHCASATGPFQFRKIAPAIVDETQIRLTGFDGASGQMDYDARFIGAIGGDCRVSFVADLRRDQGGVTITPRATSVRRAGGFFSPCEVLDPSRPASFRVGPNQDRGRASGGLVFEGADVADLCGGAARGNRVRLIWELL